MVSRALPDAGRADPAQVTAIMVRRMRSELGLSGAF